MKKRQIGLIGCGAIGQEIALAIDRGLVTNAILRSMFDADIQRSNSLTSKLKNQPTICENAEQFFSEDIDLVVEAASQQAARDFVLRALDAKLDAMVMSAGALVDPGFFERIIKKIVVSGAAVYVPSGAIAGIDAIRAVRRHIESITLVTTKSPRALAGAPFFQISGQSVDEIKQRTEIFEGNAIDAVRLFPANVNVAAILSLAGIGPQKTKVKMIADPESRTNLHEISVRGSFGELNISVNNVPSPSNPKTSYLAILSAIECLRSICDTTVSIGT